LTNSAWRFLPEAADAASAWLFPGQGAQEAGMGRDLWDASPAGRAVFSRADEVLGYAISEVCFEGPEEKLRDTEFAQPAIFTASLACLAAAVEQGAARERPAFMAGHSLGEYSALVAAGAMSFENGLLLLRERARLMAQAGAATKGTMAAILGMDEEAVRAICREADVDVCNLNLPSQTVIGGPRDGVFRAIELAKQRGAQRAMELNVSGAFHSRLMAPAESGLAAAVAATPVDAPLVGVVGNASARLLASVDDVRYELRTQIASPVRWHESVSLMAASGVTRFIEFGPGKVLTGLTRRLVPGASLVNVASFADLAAKPA
jgi:[acyl-carrier-protein] S-malonyltransferase